jgi:hypothetical protein
MNISLRVEIMEKKITGPILETTELSMLHTFKVNLATTSVEPTLKKI